MKFAIISGLICLLALTACSLSYGAEPAKETFGADRSENVVSRHPVGNKAARGAKNVLFGWTEIPKRVVDITRETRNPIWGVVAGVFQGTGKAFARTASGVVDIATAPVRPNDRPFVQDDMNVQ